MGGQPRVTLFSTSRCGYCRQAKRFLQQHRIPFQERDVLNDSRAFKAFSRAGGAGVPLILVGNRQLRGYDAGKLAAMLRQAGFDV